MRRSVGDAVTHSGLGAAVLRDARHESVQRRVWAHSPILKERWSAGTSEFIPTDAGLLAISRSRQNCMAEQKRFVGTEIPVSEARHEAVGNGIDSDSGYARGRLRNANRVDGLYRGVATGRIRCHWLSWFCK